MNLRVQVNRDYMNTIFKPGREIQGDVGIYFITFIMKEDMQSEEMLSKNRPVIRECDPDKL